MGRLGKIVAAKVAAEVIDEIGDARRHNKHHHSSMSHGRPMQNNMHQSNHAHPTHHNSHQRGHAQPMQNNMHPQNQGLGRRAVRAKIIKEILD